MATVNAQSVEDFADRIIYTYPAAKFTQVAVGIGAALTPGYKTLVNNATNTSFVVPASGISAKFFKINWIIVPALVVTNNFPAAAGASVTARIDYTKLLATSLNYDGKSLQTEICSKEFENYYGSQQLRAINITDISLEPLVKLTDYTSYSTDAQIQPSSGSYSIIAYMQPRVTFYKK